MKKFLNNIYIFSKLSTILILLIVVFFITYLFYKSYANQLSLSVKDYDKEKVVSELINKNTNKIEKLNFLIDDINNSLIKIREKFQDVQNDNNSIGNNANMQIDEIKEQIYSISDQLKKIQQDRENSLKQKNNDPFSNLKKSNLSEIINLIKLKFENGKNFSQELDMLRELGSAETLPFLEKMYIINNTNFKGSEELLLRFKNETNQYISNVIVSKKNLIKPFLSFIEIQPSKKNDLSNEVLIKLRNVNDLIIKKEYKESFEILKSIKANEYFNKTFEQLNIGINFYSTLEGIIKNG